MQPGERELGLGLGADSGQRARAERTRTFTRAGQQSGLSDARLSANKNRPSALAKSIENRIQTLDFCVAPDQPWSDRASRHDHGSSINRAMRSLDSSDAGSWPGL